MAPNPHIAPGPLRRFGLKLSTALLLIGCIRWWWTSHVPLVQFGLGGAILLLAIAFPTGLAPVQRGFIFLVELINRVMTFVGLSVAFYIVITPAAILYRLISGDPLHRKYEPEAQTYWEAPDDQPSGIDPYRNQF